MYFTEKRTEPVLYLFLHAHVEIYITAFLTVQSNIIAELSSWLITHFCFLLILFQLIVNEVVSVVDYVLAIIDQIVQSL